jgi:type 1 glutamine amidotransferase
MIRDGTNLRAAASTFACTRRSLLETSGALGALGGVPNLMLLSAALTATLTGATLAGGPTRGAAAPARILYFTLSAGYRHEVIPVSREIMRKIGGASGFGIAASEDVSVFNAENLRRYAAVMFFTTGELPMNDAQKAALTGFVRAGGGFLAVHSATDTFYMWPEYGKLIGGWFNEHPWHQKVRIKVADHADPLVAFLGPSIDIDDEIYQIRDFDDRGSHVLLQLDPASVDLTLPEVHPQPYGWPLAWTRSYGAGRVFYTALGHEEAVWRDARFQQMLRNAALWVMAGADAAGSRLPIQQGGK